MTHAQPGGSPAPPPARARQHRPPHVATRPASHRIKSSPARAPKESQLPDLAAVRAADRDGIAAATPGAPIDHVTEPRLGDLPRRAAAVTVFARASSASCRTSAVSHASKPRLRLHARSTAYANKPHSRRLIEYCVARGPTSARSRTSAPPTTRSTAPTPCWPALTPAPGATAGRRKPAWPETDGPRITALARHDRKPARSRSSWTRPPRASASSPSPRTPASANPTPAKSTIPAPTGRGSYAGATRRPSPP